VHVVVGAWILWIGWFIRYCVETGGVNRATGDATTELLYLFADVLEEGIRAPATNKHNGVGGYAIKVHGHGSGGTVGVCANVFSRKAKCFLTHGANVGSEESKEASCSKP